ncbi:hypothetical protein D3C81_1529240 [compost metagenome]
MTRQLQSDPCPGSTVMTITTIATVGALPRLAPGTPGRLAVGTIKAEVPRRTRATPRVDRQLLRLQGLQLQIQATSGQGRFMISTRRTTGSDLAAGAQLRLPGLQTQFVLPRYDRNARFTPQA